MNVRGLVIMCCLFLCAALAVAAEESVGGVTKANTAKEATLLERQFAYADRLQAEELYAEAIEAYQEAADLGAKKGSDAAADQEVLSRAHFEIGNCYAKFKHFKGDRFDKALAHYLKVFEVHQGKRRGDALYAMAKLYEEELKKPELAAKCLNDFVTLFPKHEKAGAALFDAGRLLEDAKKFEDAVTTYNRCVEAYPQTKAAEDSLAQVADITLKDQKKPQDAAKIWVRFETLFPNSDRPALFNAAEILEKEKQFKEAIALYAEFQKKHPNHKSAADARKKQEALTAKYGG